MIIFVVNLRFLTVDDQPMMNQTDSYIIVVLASAILIGGLLIHARILKILWKNNKVNIFI